VTSIVTVTGLEPIASGALVTASNAPLVVASAITVRGVLLAVKITETVGGNVTSSVQLPAANVGNENGNEVFCAVDVAAPTFAVTVVVPSVAVTVGAATTVRPD
jgi:hypothetical protein